MAPFLLFFLKVFPMHADDRKFMALAIGEARKAAQSGEVPVGAVVVKGGAVIGRGHNVKESFCDPAGHAEMVAIKKAAKKLKNWRVGGTLYVTLEPCLMCMGAMVQARIERVVFGPYDPKAGACGSLYDISKDTRLNHRLKVVAGVMEKEAEKLLSGFFSALRKKKAG
jgi:tRNA(adenine34) deaminase